MSDPILLTLPTPSFDALVETLHGAKPMTEMKLAGWYRDWCNMRDGGSSWCFKSATDYLNGRR